MEIDRQRAEEDKIKHNMELLKLREELESSRHGEQNGTRTTLKKSAVPHPISGQVQYATLSKNGEILSNGVKAGHQAKVSSSSSSVGWLNPLGLLGYWFGGNNSVDSGTVIINV